MTETEYDLNNKTAVVTGASRGIGEAIARSLARHGATVVLSSRKQERLDKVAASINEQGAGRAIPIACHTGHTDAIEALFARVQAELGRLDVLVNNAATNPYFGPATGISESAFDKTLEVNIAATNPYFGPATGISESAFDKTLEVNIKGYFLMAQHAARMMTEQRSGSIINIASIAGITSAPYQVVYGMTKAAVISMTRGLARELGPFGVRVNAIAPGLTKTRFAGALFENPEIYKHFIELTPLRRHAEPEEIAGAALYLASEASSFTTGSVIVCDGGMTA